MKYKVGDIVRVKDHKFFTDKAIQSPNTLSVEESIQLSREIKRDKARGHNKYGEKIDPMDFNAQFDEFMSLWAVRDPETNDIHTEFLIDMYYYCNKEAIILDIKYLDNEGFSITNDLGIEGIEIEDDVLFFEYKGEIKEFRIYRVPGGFAHKGLAWCNDLSNLKQEDNLIMHSIAELQTRQWIKDNCTKRYNWYEKMK